MPIKPIYSDREKPAWVYDHKQKRWKGWLLDTYKSDGTGKPLKRIRIQFARRDAAERAELEIEIEKKDESLGIVRAKDKRSITLSEIFEKRLAQLDERKRRELERRVLTYFLNLTGANFNVEHLKSSHLQKYVDARARSVTLRKTPLTPQTINRELTIISSALRQAPRLFAELEDYAPPRIPRVKAKENRRTRTTTPEEKKRLVEYLTRPIDEGETFNYFTERIRVAHALRFAWLTGARKKEAAMLEWSQYEPKRDRLRIYRYKNKTESVFSPVPKRLVELLEERKYLSTGKFVFTLAGEFSGYFESIIASACNAAGINYGRFVPDGFTFHTARHDFITNLLQRGVDIETVRELAGISKSEILLLYAHASAESRKRAVLIIDDF